MMIGGYGNRVLLEESWDLQYNGVDDDCDGAVDDLTSGIVAFSGNLPASGPLPEINNAVLNESGGAVGLDGLVNIILKDSSFEGFPSRYAIPTGAEGIVKELVCQVMGHPDQALALAQWTAPAVANEAFRVGQLTTLEDTLNVATEVMPAFSVERENAWFAKLAEMSSDSRDPNSCSAQLLRRNPSDEFAQWFARSHEQTGYGSSSVGCETLFPKVDSGWHIRKPQRAAASWLLMRAQECNLDSNTIRQGAKVIPVLQAAVKAKRAKPHPQP